MKGTVSETLTITLLNIENLVSAALQSSVDVLFVIYT